MHDGELAKGKKRGRARNAPMFDQTLRQPCCTGLAAGGCGAAHQLARFIYTMLFKGEEYTDQGQTSCQERCREQVLRQLSQRANKLGMQLVAVAQPV